MLAPARLKVQLLSAAAVIFTERVLLTGAALQCGPYSRL